MKLIPDSHREPLVSECKSLTTKLRALTKITTKIINSGEIIEKPKKTGSEIDTSY